VIGVRLYAAPLPGGATALVVTPTLQADLASVGRLVAAHPEAIRIDVLAAPGTGVDGEAARTLMLRAASVVTLGGGAAQAQHALGPSGRWYAALVIWGWLLLLAAGQSLAQVAGGLWLAIGLPWTRGAYARTRAARQEPIAEWLGAALAAANARVHEHASMGQLAERLAEPSSDLPAQRRGSAEGINTAAFRHLAAGCVPAGVRELAPFYGALAAGQLPGDMWSYLPAAPMAMTAVPPTAERASQAGEGHDETEPANEPDTAQPESAAREAQAA
jgi:hypothetical protein